MKWQKIDERWKKCFDVPPGQTFEGCVKYELQQWEVPGEEPLQVRYVKSSAHPLKDYSGSRQFEKTSICLHLTCGFGGFSMLGGNGIASAHFLLGRDGTAYLVVPTEIEAYHATWWNQNSIGIEVDNIGMLRKQGDKLMTFYKTEYCKESEKEAYLEKDFRGGKYWATWPEAQYKGLGRLIKAIAHKHKIPLYILPEESRYKAFNSKGDDRKKFKGVLSHVNVDPANRADIGPYIDWPRLIREAGLTEGDCFNAPPYQPAAPPKPASAPPPEKVEEEVPKKEEAKEEKPPPTAKVKEEKPPKPTLSWEQVEQKVAQDEYKLVGDYSGGFIDADLQLLADQYCGQDGVPSRNLGPDGLPLFLAKWTEKVGGATAWDRGAQGRAGLAEAFCRSYFRDLCKQNGMQYSPSADELFAELFKSEKNGKGAELIGLAPRKPAPPKKKEEKKEEKPAEEGDKWHTIPPRPGDAATGSKFFEELGKKERQEREDAALAELLKGNIPNFLRNFVEVKLTAKGHTGSVWVSPDVLAIGSDEDFVRIPLNPLTAQQVQDFYSTTFVTSKLSDDVHAAAEIKLDPIAQTAWYNKPPDHNMETSAFYLESNRRIELAREKAGGKLGQLTSGVKKDVILSIKLNKQARKNELGERSVVIYGWHYKNGKNIQPESDIHENTYVDYSHGIRLVSQKMIVDGKPMKLFDVLANRELAPLLLKPTHVLDAAFPPPNRYKLAVPHEPNKAAGAGDSADVKEKAKEADQTVETEFASSGEKLALNLGPKLEPKLKPLVEKYKTALLKPAKDLSKAEASIILAFLHHAGFVALIDGWSNKNRKAPQIEGSELKWPNANVRPGFAPWVKFKDEGDPIPAPDKSKVGPVPGHFGFVYNGTAKKGLSRDEIKSKTAPGIMLDPRNAVALYRAANWLSEKYGVTELHHAGVNGSDPKTRNDCHGQGRALDFAGVTGNMEGKAFEFMVTQDWGTAKVPADRKGKTDHDWVEKNGITSYRLAERLEEKQPSPARFFWDFYKFLAQQYACGGKGELPKKLDEKADGGMIMHPDHATSKPNTSNGREAHYNHIHCQIGDTGTAKADDGMKEKDPPSGSPKQEPAKAAEPEPEKKEEPKEPPKDETEKRGRSVVNAARIELARGVEKHGKGKAWATSPNSGPIVDDYQKAAGILSGKSWGIPQKTAHWCGNFVGFCYRKAGFDMDGELSAKLSVTGTKSKKKLVFWSTVRLDHYWKNAPGCKRIAFPYQRTMKKDECIEWLKEHLHPFAPQPGDIALVTTMAPMAHVAMVASYDPKTFQLVTHEGNFNNRGAAARWNLSEPGPKGFNRVNVIGRFPASDFTKDPEVAHDASTPDPDVEGARFISGRHDE